MSKRVENVVKTIVQVLAALALLGILSMIAHKAFGDLSVLARDHAGEDFWLALLRYVFRNLAGG